MLNSQYNNLFTTMLKMQDKMNRKINPQWVSEDYEWYRAIWIECAELLEHHGQWKWWKKGEPNMDQVHLELIDIWHFGMSDLIQHGAGIHVIASFLSAIASESNTTNEVGFIESVELLSSSCLVNKEFSPNLFFPLLKHSGMEIEDLFSGYVSKNVLNEFRQDKGYKTGTYIKTWGGKEDNEHLADIVKQMDKSSPSFSETLYSKLSERYSAFNEPK